MSRINDASLNQIGGDIQLYKYEPFSQFVTVNPTYANTSLSFTTSSPQLFSFLSNVDVSTIAFSSVNGPSISSSGLSLVVNAISNASTVETKTYTVNIGTGRFTNPPSNYPFVFYKNEPIETNASSLFVSSIPNISKPVSTTSLPAGIGFVYNDICSYYLTGTPLITYPQSNYNIIASDASSRTINTFVNIRVNPERVVVDNSGTSTITGAAIDTSITPLSVVGRCPPYPYTGNILAYTWTPSLPDGLRFTNSAGVTLSNGEVPSSDSSSTIILQGAITSAGAKSLSSSNLNITLTGTRTFSPVISDTANLSVTFEESVVFDVPTISGVYKDASFTYTSNYNTFRAYTLFADASITSMTASSLPTGVYLDFSSNAQRGYLVGTPTALETCNATITATNANAKTRDLPVTIAVSNDSLSFSVFPASSTFIVGRSLSNAKQGYYSSPLTFTASSGSGCNVTMSMTGISGTGLTFSGTPGSTATYTLTGSPTTVSPLTTAVVTANVAATSKTVNSNFVYEIVPDVFTFSADPSLVLIQNVPMTPVTINATTLSGLPIIQYLSANIPGGLNIAANGKISGTPLISDTSGTFSVFATTGPTSGTSPTYTYTLTPDSILLFAQQSSYTYTAGCNVSIQITGLSYSAATVGNYQFSGLPTTGLTIGSSSGLITGPLSDSVPPNPVLPAGTTLFDVCGSVGTKYAGLPATFTTTNPIVNRSFLGWNRPLTAVLYEMDLLTNDTSSLVTGWESSNLRLDSTFTGEVVIQNTFISDFKVKNTSVDSNLFLGTLTDTSGHFIRSTDGVTFTDVYVTDSLYFDPVIVSSLANKTGTSTWFAAGSDVSLGNASNVYLKKSTDDGLTWSNAGQITSSATIRTRDLGTPIIGIPPSTPYISSGTSLAYKDGILIAGGYGSENLPYASFLLSSNDGTTWSKPSGTMLDKETATINVDGSGVWVISGSSVYDTFNLGLYGSDANTIVYSTDNGSSWSAPSPVVYDDGEAAGSNGVFNYIGYDVVYGNGCWLASGISVYTNGLFAEYYYEVRATADGSNWKRIPYFNSLIPSTGSAQYGKLGPILYANDAWNVLSLDLSGIFTYTKISSRAGTAYGDVSGLLTGWSGEILGLPGFGGIGDGKIPTYRAFTAPQYVRTGFPTQATITFTETAGGPTFTAPSQRSYVFYQYMPITPITFSATGTGTVYFFVQAADLPTGLVWNPYTATITGKSVELGKESFTVYAKDDVGVSSTVIQTETIIPRVIRQQTSAGAYTYLLKQYTEVLGAQASRDKKALPDEDSTLGKFMGPPAPDVMSASNTCGCPTK